jgi:hypothetical protein
MEKPKEIKLKYVFSSLVATNHQPSQSALQAKNIVLDIVIKKIIFTTN